MLDLVIAIDDPARPDVSALLAAHLRFTTSTSPPEDMHALDVGGLSGPGLSFFSARAADGRVVAVGALKRWLLAASAVGSLKEEIAPLHMVIPDQLIDRTHGRVSTYFGGGLVGHVSLADPFCPTLTSLLADAAERAGATVHRGGAYVCIEGPQFSSRAESHMYRGWGASIIGMTAFPEARLAREAELHYAMIAQSTDYDCWRESEEVVSADMVVANVAKNISTVRRALQELTPAIPRGQLEDGCSTALRHAIQTAPEAISPEAVERLGIIYSTYAAR